MQTYGSALVFSPRYSVHIIDEYSNYHWVKFTRTKAGAFSAIIEWVRMIGIDGGSEFGQATMSVGDTHTVYGCYQVCAAIRRLAVWVEEDFRRWWLRTAELPTPPNAPLPAPSAQG